jgi:integrase/recombinase XerD
MNRRSESSFILSKALEGFVNHKYAEGLSPRSITSYERLLKKWIKYEGNKPINKVTKENIREYMRWLRTDYKPIRKNGRTEPLSPKTVRNVWVTLSSFFGWAVEEFGIDNPMIGIPAPKYKKKTVEAYTKDEIEALLKACEYTRKADTGYRMSFTMRRSTAKRDRAILLLLLDTGLRASELCALKRGNVTYKTGRVEIVHGTKGGAKGGKGRVVYLGRVTRKALWRYLAERDQKNEDDFIDNPDIEPLFLTIEKRPMTPNALRFMVKRLGEKAGLKNVYPHKFRHTFAITYLRSGGDVFTLQSLLGHSDLKMVRHYARIAEVDVRGAHRRASPADNWRL